VLSESGRLEAEQVARIAEAVLSALRAAHEGDRQIVHRDVKPANILLADDGRILLTDFGIAKAIDDTTVTVSGTFVGSVAYIAPERAEGAHGGPPADLFSLGVTLFEAVEGFSPFQRDTHTGTLTAILVKPLPPMAHAGRLETLIQALTAKDPVLRPTAAQALAQLHGSYSEPRVPDGHRMQETVQLPAPGIGQTPRMRLPWQTVDVSRTTGGPKPSIAGTQEPPPTASRPRAPWVLAIIFAALIIPALRLKGLTGTTEATYLVGDVRKTVSVEVTVSTQTALGWWHSGPGLGKAGALLSTAALAAALAAMIALRPSTPTGIRIAGYAAAALATVTFGLRILQLAWEDNRAEALALSSHGARIAPAGGKPLRYHEATHAQAGVFVFAALLVLMIAGYAWCEIRTRQGSSGNVSSHTPTSSAKPA
jgi:hypothetical protein